MWLTLAAMRNGIAILMASLAIVLLGATSLGRMPIDLFPNLNYPSLQVGTIYKGASAQDIERSVTYPIEKAVSAVANVRYVESRSRQGFSAVTVQFAWGADIDAGLTEVVQRIQAIMSSLPTGIQQPFIVKFDLSNIPVCILTVSGALDERALYDLAYNTIEPQIERLAGVASANVDGGKIRQITVNLDRDRLYSKGLSVNEVTRAVNDANFLLPSGDVKLGSFDYNVFTNNQFSVVAPMEDIVVRRTGTTPIRLRDVGRVEDSAETQVSIVRVNGERAVYLRVNKQPGANTVEVVDAVKATVPKLLGVPPGVNVSMSLDQSTYIRQSIENLWHEAAIGSLLAFLVILVFLRSFVSTVIIGIAIPLSLMLTLVAMYFLGQTSTSSPWAALPSPWAASWTIPSSSSRTSIATSPSPARRGGRPCWTPPAKSPCPSSSPPSRPSWSSCPPSSSKASRGCSSSPSPSPSPSRSSPPSSSPAP